jgi:hypothetical protein
MHANLNRTNNRSLPIMQNEKIRKSISFALMSNHMMLLPLNHLMSGLITSGIAQRLFDYDIWYQYRPVEYEIEDPRRILSLTDLEYGFVLWLVACLVSFVCFVCELSLKVKSELKNLIAMIDFLRVLRARMNNYHDTW